MHEWFAHENQPMALQKIYKRKRKWEIGVVAIDFRKATLTYLHPIFIPVELPVFNRFFCIYCAVLFVCNSTPSVDFAEEATRISRNKDLTMRTYRAGFTDRLGRLKPSTPSWTMKKALGLEIHYQDLSFICF